MKFVQYYLDCLSHASYLVGDESTGRAVVVDPRRDIQDYLDDAAAAGLRIEMVINTHFHADFVSGHLELAHATGAEIAFGEPAKADYPMRQLHDRERISLGDVTLEVLATPGHTPESISIVVYEHTDDEVPYGVLTGDTLFIGDVGRPDLLGALGFTADQLGRMLYHSLREKLLPLPDATRVYPAHGAGSACGRNLGTATSSTMGEQRRLNYALQPMSEDEFVRIVTEGQPTAPLYFVHDAVTNRKERGLLDEHATPKEMTLDEVLAAQADGAVVLDYRTPAEYAAGHLKGALQTSLDTRFAEYAGSIVAPGTPIILTGDPAAAREAKNRLGRVGFDTVIGQLPNLQEVLMSHPDIAARTSRLETHELRQRQAEMPGLRVIDVRNPGEHKAGAIEGSENRPLATLRENLDGLDPNEPVVLYCQSGNRSVIAASLLESRGFSDVSDLLGGYEALALQTVAG